MASVTLKNLCKHHPGGVTAVSDLSLEIPDRSFFVLAGPARCGLSTVLRLVAGLETPSDGGVSLSGFPVDGRSPRERGVALVSRHSVPYPNMTVFDNLAFGLKLGRETSATEIRARVAAAADLLDLGDVLALTPSALTDSQCWRLSLGRAIARRPRVYLFDDPLSGLEDAARAARRAELAALHKRVASTFLFATHDQTEAMTLGERIAVIKNGLLQQVAAPQGLYDRPANLLVADFFGSPPMNLIETSVLSREGTAYLRFGACQLPLPEDRATRSEVLAYVDRSVIMGIRPEDLHDELDRFPLSQTVMDVTNIEVAGLETHLRLTNGDCDITARLSHRPAVKPGDSFRIAFDPQKIHLFDKDTGRSVLTPF
ncbi:MAG: ABC transporter ATP-binding protein [Oscillospiraceae bacterium]|jgi:multiple sugar transport system ATP-binding protein|nr:ABC transporter ATP-binding protein [Oscillospiraceae bacterium]